jgi:hypothetical protein
LGQADGIPFAAKFLFKQSGSHVREVGDGTLPIIAAQYSLYALA